MHFLLRLAKEGCCRQYGTRTTLSSKSKVIPEPRGPLGGTSLRFSSPQLALHMVAVDMDIHGCIHGYIDGYIHVWIADLGCTMDISMDISTSLKDMISMHLVVP